MIILAVDPGKRAGWACLTDDGLEASGVVDGDDVRMIDEIFTCHAPDVLVVEDQYFRPRKLKGMKTLFRRRFTWEIIGRLRNIEVEEIAATAWQGHFRIRRGDKVGVGQMARALAGKECAADEADAVCMAYWYQMTMTRFDIGG